jgi:hypothetical protein
VGEALIYVYLVMSRKQSGDFRFALHTQSWLEPLRLKFLNMHADCTELPMKDVEIDVTRAVHTDTHNDSFALLFVSVSKSISVAEQFMSADQQNVVLLLNNLYRILERRFISSLNEVVLAG